MNKQLKNYLNQLILLGVICVILGIALTFLVFSDSNTSQIFIPVIITNSTLTYLLITFVGKGGNVNFYLAPHKPSSSEKMLNKLIEDNRSVFLMTLSAIIVVSIEVAYLIVNLKNSDINMEHFIGLSFMSFVNMVLICQGVKFISAWWNIKKNWKKDFKK